MVTGPKPAKILISAHCMTLLERKVKSQRKQEPQILCLGPEVLYIQFLPDLVWEGINCSLRLGSSQLA